MALSESIVQAIEAGAGQHGYEKVSLVRIEVGPLAGVEKEALRFCFDAVARGTIADGARFEILETEARAWCLPCGKSVVIQHRLDSCPECGSAQLQVQSGDEMRIKELEVN
ncbi:hydrogenase maturation nickel metallochaperone HypA [Dongia sp.]|uniref:hydrogenase maturation nickel metallochaperone HypA n=1 Tax=Dongia sp. TaxID=1977262 RepID=UPI0035B01713